MSAGFSLVADSASDGPVAVAVTRRHIATLAAALTVRLSEVTDHMCDLLVRQIPELDGDPVLTGLLATSVEGTFFNLLGELQYDIGGSRQEPPAAAIDFARRLAQRGVPVNALVRTCWLEQQFLLRRAFDDLQGVRDVELLRADAYDSLVHHVFDYFDWVSQRLVGVYEDERQAWPAGNSRARNAMVRQLLDEDASVDVSIAQNVIGYRLSGYHVAVVAWTPKSRIRSDQGIRSTRVIRAFAEEVGAGVPLVIGIDHATSWAWLPVPRSWEWEPAWAQWTWPDGPSPLLALGGCQVGPSGFRRSHEQALQVQRTASVAGMRERTTLSYDEPGVAPTALLSQNLGLTRTWIREVLGEVARDNDSGARHRQTLLAFLRNDMSYVATAEEMVMHRNSIKHRIDSAEAALGRPITGNRLSVELALTACELLGSAVLTPATQAQLSALGTRRRRFR